MATGAGSRPAPAAGARGRGAGGGRPRSGAAARCGGHPVCPADGRARSRGASGRARRDPGRRPPLIFLDTSVLIYAVGGGHPLRAPSLGLAEHTRRGRREATTTVEVIQEFAHVYARRRPRSDVVRLGRAWAALLSPLASTERHHLERGLALFEAHDRLGAFDAVLAAAAIEAGAAALVSADRAFASVPELPFVDLAAPGLDELLA